MCLVGKNTDKVHLFLGWGDIFILESILLDKNV